MCYGYLCKVAQRHSKHTPPKYGFTNEYTTGTWFSSTHLSLGERKFLWNPSQLQLHGNSTKKEVRVLQQILKRVLGKYKKYQWCEQLYLFNKNKKSRALAKIISGKDPQGRVRTAERSFQKPLDLLKIANKQTTTKQFDDIRSFMSCFKFPNLESVWKSNTMEVTFVGITGSKNP